RRDAGVIVAYVLKARDRRRRIGARGERAEVDDIRGLQAVVAGIAERVLLVERDEVLVAVGRRVRGRTDGFLLEQIGRRLRFLTIARAVVEDVLAAIGGIRVAQDLAGAGERAEVER